MASEGLSPAPLGPVSSCAAWIRLVPNKKLTGSGSRKMEGRVQMRTCEDVGVPPLWSLRRMVDEKEKERSSERGVDEENRSVGKQRRRQEEETRSRGLLVETVVKEKLSISSR
ncbi:unnamed protein product [Pleuronectes platessa]|uniref:Uncharacterized protein n=1 Tax=Pleuronectes platessa TaxID=8262 RepID=A0A9N7Z9G7_PLEPL|nr:unnamed protein product [Pleuronectes platessa]